jgi:hypothetical protein
MVVQKFFLATKMAAPREILLLSLVSKRSYIPPELLIQGQPETAPSPPHFRERICAVECNGCHEMKCSEAGLTD